MLRDRLARPFRAVRRAVLVRRRLLAALLTAVAVAAGLHAAAAPPPPSVRVLTAARDLPAGAVVAEADLAERAFAPDTAPAGLADDAVGRTLASPLRRGEPVTDVRLVGPELTSGRPDLTPVPVRFPDAAMVDLLEVGDVIDLVATDPQAGGASVVAPGVPVLAIPRSEEGADGGHPGALVVVGASATDLTAIADAGARLFLTFAYSR
jgi:hypothetical protein